MTEKIEVSSKSKISGHVFSKDGAVLNGAKIICDELETAALADGYYTFDNLPSGTHEVSVNLQGFQPESKTVTTRDGDVTVLDFYLSEAVGTSSIRGHVYDSESNKPLVGNGAVILIHFISNKYVRVDEKGCYEFANLPAGTYKLLTSIPDYDETEAMVAIGEGELKTYDFSCKARRTVEPPWG